MKTSLRGMWVAALCAAACTEPSRAPHANASHNAPAGAVIALSGGTLIDGNGGTPIENSVVVIEQGKIKEGSLVLLTAFGGGVTWGGTLIRF